MSAEPTDSNQDAAALDARFHFSQGLANQPPAVSEVAEDEWNFAKCPKPQLHACQIYEYGRSSPSLIKRVASWRKEKFARAEAPLKHNGELETLQQMDFFRLFPEFPQTPWLALDREDVKRRLKALPKRSPILVRIAPVEALKDGDTYLNTVEVIEPFHTATIQPVEINWFYHDKEIIADVKKLLTKLRPYRAKEKRGRTEPRVLLNALAAKRLLARHTVAACLDITDEVLGKPLFSGDSDWYDARQRADDHLAGRLPSIPIARLLKKLPKAEFTEPEINQLWQYWVGLKVSEARSLYLLSTEKFTAKMRAELKKMALT